jgi:hypothetical protein
MPRGKPDDRVRLLFGPYRAPGVRVGDQAVCLARDCDVVVTSWTDGRISWPRCRAPESHGGGSGILVEEELARAVRNKSAVAIGFWWGANCGTVSWWRRALGVTRTSSEGSRRLCQAVAEAAAAKVRGTKLPPDQCERRRQTAKALNLSQHLQPGYHGPWWTAEEIALLGSAPDADVSTRIGRSVDAVRVVRTRLGIVSACDRRRRENRTH